MGVFMHPFINLFGLHIPAYGMLLASAICVGVGLTVYRFQSHGGSLENALIISACTIGFALLGGHLLYLLESYGISNIIRDIKAGSLSFLSSGGLVFYGSLVFGIFGVFFGFKISHETSTSLFIRAAVPCIPLGHAIGRVGCFLGGCCYGLPYSGFGAVSLAATGNDVTVFPIQLIESTLNLVIFFRLLFLSRREHSRLFLLYAYLFYYSITRFVLEFFRGDVIRGFALGLSTSQWISFLLFCVSAPLVIKERRFIFSGDNRVSEENF